jgi:hypothetical protein
MIPPRCTAEDVQAVLTPGGDYDGTSDLTVFIETASDLVDTVVAAGGLSRTGILLSVSIQKRLETWLAAAMYCFSDQQEKSGNTGPANSQYRGQDGLFLESNMYGRMACMIDVSRILKPLVEGRVAGISWLGKTPSNQIPYYLRR